MSLTVPFNALYTTGQEITNIKDALSRGKLSGNGYYTHECQHFFESRYGFNKTLLTTSCTAALEMVALLLDIKPGDEIIAPSYTFVSTVNPFILRGAKILFVDSLDDHPNMDVSKLKVLISSKTKAIIAVHYAGMASDIDVIADLCKRQNLVLIEDAAQAIDAYYQDKPLGSFGTFGAFSFHDTKNITCGEGGLLIINDDSYISQAEILWEKGTNRAAFSRGEINKYGWVGMGSSFLMADLNAAFLLAQLQQIRTIQTYRLQLWNHYQELLQPLSAAGFFTLPQIPDDASHNAHTYYICVANELVREQLIAFLKSKGISTAAHYQSLHNSKFFAAKHDSRELLNSVRFTDTLLRLPLHMKLVTKHQVYIVKQLTQFFKKNIL